jgi:toxin YoeB
MYELIYTRQAQKDAKKLAQSGLKRNASKILEIIKEDTFQNSPSYEKLLGDLADAYTRRINIQHRIVYQVHEKEKIVKVISMWTHYK